MPTTKNTIPKILLKALSNTYTLYYTAQAAHWNIEGQTFLQLHQLFQTIYEDATDSIDQIAERIRQYDVKLPNTIQELTKDSSITYSPDMSYIENLLIMNNKLESTWDDIAQIAEDAEDSATVDMAGKRAGTHSKFAWMLRSLTKES